MPAVVVHGKLDLRVEEVHTPEPAEGQVRLRTAFGGVCGLGLHHYDEGANGEHPVRETLVPGHEFSGAVDLDPSGEFAPGTPVAVHPVTFGSPEPGSRTGGTCGRAGPASAAPARSSCPCGGRRTADVPR